MRNSCIMTSTMKFSENKLPNSLKIISFNHLDYIAKFEMNEKASFN